MNILTLDIFPNFRSHRVSLDDVMLHYLITHWILITFLRGNENKSQYYRANTRKTVPFYHIRRILHENTIFDL